MEAAQKNFETLNRRSDPELIDRQSRTTRQLALGFIALFAVVAGAVAWLSDGSGAQHVAELASADANIAGIVAP